MPKVVNLGGQTVLPDRLVLLGQKLVENAKIQKFKCDILSDFQTLYRCIISWCLRNLDFDLENAQKEARK